MDTDLQLLARYHRLGDAGAFQSLMGKYSGLVFATARRITQDATLAEEVAQDTFLALARRGRSIKDSVAAWLHRVARQKAANVVRSEQRRRVREQRAAAVLHESPESSWAEIEPLIDAALDELPDGLRLLVIEHYLGQRTQQEIASHHGLSQSTVSRQLDKGLRLLRQDLRRRGIGAGLGLGALLTTNVDEAAPASLTAALGKLTLSGIGASSPVLASLANLAAMKSLWMALLPGALLIGALACDLASDRSLLLGWFSAPTVKSTSRLPKASKTKSIATNSDEQRWAAEAKEIWANAPKTSGEALLMAIDRFVEEKDTSKRLALLHSVGISLSHATLESLIKEHRAENKWRTDMELWGRVCRTFFIEHPREAVAWAYHILPVNTPRMKVSNLDALNWVLAHRMTANIDGVSEDRERTKLNWILAHRMTANPCEPGAWESFLAASPDPRVPAFAERWKQIAADPATLWSRAVECGLSDSEVHSYILKRMEESAPDSALALLQRSPNTDFRKRAIVGLAPRLAADQLLALANDGFGDNASLSNLFRTMAGDPSASFTDAAAFALSATQAVPHDPVYSEWAAQCMQQVYARWSLADPGGALRQAAASGLQEYLERFMSVAVKAGDVTDGFISHALASATPRRRDAALAEFYRAQADNDPQETLRRIAASPFIEDQVQSAKNVLTDWAKADPDTAASWLNSLPAGQDRAELAAKIAGQWVDRDPEAAVAFIRREEVRLRDCQGELAFSLRRCTEDRLRSLLAPLRGDQDYNRLVVTLAGYRLPSDPLVAFDFINRHSGKGWQSLVVGDTVRWLKDGDARAEDYVQALPTMDLNAISTPQMAAAAELVARKFQEQGKAREAFDWALRLRSAAAPDARAAVVAQLATAKSDQRDLLTTWIAKARLDSQESTALLRLVAEISGKAAQ